MRDVLAAEVRSLRGLVVNVCVQVSPEDAVSNVSRWIKAVGFFRPPHWLVSENADKIVHWAAVVLMISGPSWVGWQYWHSKMEVVPDFKKIRWWINNEVLFDGKNMHGPMQMASSGELTLTLENNAESSIYNPRLQLDVRNCAIMKINAKLEMGNLRPEVFTSYMDFPGQRITPGQRINFQSMYLRCVKGVALADAYINFSADNFRNGSYPFNINVSKIQNGP
mgnify:FL=1